MIVLETHMQDKPLPNIEEKEEISHSTTQIRLNKPQQP